MALSLEDKALILSFGYMLNVILKFKIFFRTSKYAYKQLLNDSGESVFNKRRRSPLGFGSGMVNLFRKFFY